MYRYGAPAAMSPAWMGWALCAVACGLRAEGDAVPYPRAQLGFTLGAFFVLLFPFKGTDALEFQFDRFTTWPLPDEASMWFALALLGKARAVRAQQGRRAAARCGAARGWRC